jgi:L-aminopeptidase/D-esterase-like protein
VTETATTNTNMKISNDHLDLTPQPPPPGPVLEFDFPGLAIGVAEYPEGPTGCTVFHFSDLAAMQVDVRGGSPSVVGALGRTHAICLTGGSIYGMQAVAGVGAELLAQRDYDASWQNVGLSAGAVIYDYGARQNTIHPDAALGRAALRWAAPGRFPLGPRGAGCSATTGKGFLLRGGEMAGQGGAFRQIGETRIAVFTVVNAVGVIVDRAGKVVRGGLDRATGQRSFLIEESEQIISGEEPPLPVPEAGNTTLTVVVTNQQLDDRSLSQFGRQVHASMARAIQPFHTLYDGDVLFAVSTNQHQGDGLDVGPLATIASEVAWDAVLTSFYPLS